MLFKALSCCCDLSCNFIYNYDFCDYSHEGHHWIIRSTTFDHWIRCVKYKLNIFSMNVMWTHGISLSLHGLPHVSSFYFQFNKCYIKKIIDKLDFNMWHTWGYNELVTLVIFKLHCVVWKLTITIIFLFKIWCSFYAIMWQFEFKS
jgi:hypothetical protein